MFIESAVRIILLIDALAYTAVVVNAFIHLLLLQNKNIKSSKSSSRLVWKNKEEGEKKNVRNGAVKNTTTKKFVLTIFILYIFFFLLFNVFCHDFVEVPA